MNFATFMRLADYILVALMFLLRSEMRKDKHTDTCMHIRAQLILLVCHQELVQQSFPDWDPCPWKLTGLSKIKDGLKSAAESGPQKSKCTLSTVALIPSFKSKSYQAIALVFL